MDEITKRAIKKTILALRKLLEKEDITAVLKQHGIFPDGRRVPAEKIALLNDAGRARRERLEAILEREIKSAANDPKAGVERYCREVTFTYLNRLIALRCMEVRGLIEECIKTRTDYAGRSLKHNRFRKECPEKHFDGEDTDGLKAFLRSVFYELQDDIKILFDPDDEYSIIMPSLKALRECIRALNEDIPENVFKAPELIGWVYQYFQTKEKDRVFEEVRTKKKKIQGDDIVPATSLYTERYMVDYLVQNSLGAIWMEMYPDSNLCKKWPYFVKDQDLKPREPRSVKSLTFLDSACGSGHFLLIAFDLFVQMYEEETRLADERKITKDWVVSKEKIGVTILESNLHGIDIDLRSLQLSWLVLYLKMREHQKSVAAPKSLPEKANLIAADASLLDSPEFLSWCEDKFKEEPYVLNIIKGVAGRLRNLPEIGSLARPEEDLKELIRKEKERLLSAWKKDKGQLVIFPEFLAPQQRELPFEKVTDEQFWESVLRQVIKALDEYYREASERGDTRTQIMAHEAAKGFGFLELCNKRYDVVATNPPYMGSKNMGKELKDYVQSVYPEGKRDLYAAFIQRNREWTKERGIVSMVTQQSWMFLRSFVNMREEILKENCVQTLAHLGEHAFDDPAAAGAFVVLFTLANEKPGDEHRLVAFRVIEGKSSSDKIELLTNALNRSTTNLRYRIRQLLLNNIPDSTVVYSLSEKFLNLFNKFDSLEIYAELAEPLHIRDNLRFIRFWWEVLPSTFGVIRNNRPIQGKWFLYQKGGGYKKWYGFNNYVVDWENNGARIKNFPKATVGFENSYFQNILTFTAMYRGKLGVRFVENAICDVASTPILSSNCDLENTICTLNSRTSSLILRCIMPALRVDLGYVKKIPFPPSTDITFSLGAMAIELKKFIVDTDILEYTFCCPFNFQKKSDTELSILNRIKNNDFVISVLHLIEGVVEHDYMRRTNLNEEDILYVYDQVGTPAGWHPLIAGYDKIRETDLPAEFSARTSAYETPKEVIEYLNNHKRISPSQEELNQIKSRMRALYEAGPGAKMEDVIEEKDADASDDEDESEALIGKRIPIPTETFLEELSVKMEIHPISIYWLLKEMREKEGVVCWPECKRYVEDYFTVMILRMLGFRWPKQIEANEPVPEWADKDGIIPITDHTGEKTLPECIRDRIGAEFGDDRLGAIEQEFSDILYNADCKSAEIKGKRPPRKKMSLSEWLEKEFFKRHTSQFKKRPIAWYLTSSNGTFQVLLFYHKLSGDILKNLKNRYLAKVQSYYGVLLERTRIGESVPGGLTLGKLQDIEDELEDFATRLDKVINLPYEPLIDDGVRVNIAPLQKVGLLKHPVLAIKDVDRAIADRNCWREDDKEQNTVWRP